MYLRPLRIEMVKDREVHVPPDKGCAISPKCVDCPLPVSCEDRKKEYRPRRVWCGDAPPPVG